MVQWTEAMQTIALVGSMIIAYTAAIVGGAWVISSALTKIWKELADVRASLRAHTQLFQMHAAEDKQRFDDLDARLDVHKISRLRK
jgi:hypothetical protein